MPYYRRKGSIKSQPVEYKGIQFPSKTEFETFRALEQLRDVGEISEIELQPKFELYEKLKNLRTENKLKGFSPDSTIIYTSDFRYFDLKTKRRVVVESKGHMTDLNKMKLRLFLQHYLPEYDFAIVTAVWKKSKGITYLDSLDWHWYIYDTNPPKKKRN